MTAVTRDNEKKNPRRAAKELKRNGMGGTKNRGGVFKRRTEKELVSPKHASYYTADRRGKKRGRSRLDAMSGRPRNR